MSSQSNRQTDEVLYDLPPLPEPHARSAMRFWENVCRQRPTLHPTAGTARVLPQRLGKACGLLQWTRIHALHQPVCGRDATIEMHTCRGMALAHTAEQDQALVTLSGDVPERRCTIKSIRKIWRTTL
jgi:hypothetical protein